MLRGTETHYSKELEQVEKDKEEETKLALEYQELKQQNDSLNALSQKNKAELEILRGKQHQRIM